MTVTDTRDEMSELTSDCLGLFSVSHHVSCPEAESEADTTARSQDEPGEGPL